MTTAVSLSTALIQETVEVPVCIKEHWDDEWERVYFLYCNRLNWCANPQIPSAEFEWRFGRGLQPGGSTFQDIEPKDIYDWWVRVEVPQYDSDGDPLTSKYWYGIFTDRQDELQGGKYGKAGSQIIVAHGPEILLSRQVIDSCWTLDGELNDPHHLRRALPFNEGCRRRPRGGFEKTKYKDRPGNRSPDADLNGVYLFDDYPTTTATERQAWTYRQIVDYLLAYQAPQDKSGVTQVPFKVNADSETYIPVWKASELQQHGRTLKEVLDDILDRRRLLGYCLEYNNVLDGFLLRAFNYLQSALVLGDGFDLPGNTAQKTWDFDDCINVAGIHFRESEIYGQVKATGSRVVCCFTISDLDGTLWPHWTLSQQTSYCLAASGLAAYADYDPSQKEAANRIARADESVKKVFTTFGMDNGWNGYVGNGIGTGDTSRAFPFTDLSLSTDPTVNEVWYVPGMRFTRLLPLKSEHDYSGLNISYDEIPTTLDPSASWDYIPMMVLYPLTNEVDPFARTYIDLAKMGQLNDIEIAGDGNGFPSSCSVGLETEAPAFRLVCHGEYGQHAFGAGEGDYKFTPLSYGSGYSEPSPALSWEKFICTVAAEADYFVTSNYPVAPSGDPDCLKVLHIDASQFCDLHYVAPLTIVGLNKGALTRTETGGIIKDDRKLLEMISRVAYEWYSVKRQALTIGLRGALKPVEVGDLIVEIGNEDNGTDQAIRTVVTEIEINFARTESSIHTTKIQTQWAEFDVLKMFV